MNEIDFDFERYVKSITNTLNEVIAKDGYVQLEDLWVATSLPKDLILDIIKNKNLEFVKEEIKGVKYKNKTYMIKRGE
jgi:hypothetical protein